MADFSNKVLGSIADLLGAGSGLQQTSGDEQALEAERARKKRQQMQAQQGQMKPYSASAMSLLNTTGNQY